MGHIDICSICYVHYCLGFLWFLVFGLEISEMTYNVQRRTLNPTQLYINKKAVLPQGNRAMLQVFFSVEVRQQHSLQV